MYETELKRAFVDQIKAAFPNYDLRKEKVPHGVELRFTAPQFISEKQWVFIRLELLNAYSVPVQYSPGPACARTDVTVSLMDLTLFPQITPDTYIGTDIFEIFVAPEFKFQHFSQFTDRFRKLIFQMVENKGIYSYLHAIRTDQPKHMLDRHQILYTIPDENLFFEETAKICTSTPFIHNVKFFYSLASAIARKHGLSERSIRKNYGRILKLWKVSQLLCQ